MKFKSAIHRQRVGTRIMAAFLAIIILATFAPIAAQAAVVPIATDTVSITETTGSNGFTHPGVGLTKLILDNMRQQIIDQKEPWYSYYKAMTVSSNASTTVTSSNASPTDPTKPASVEVNGKGPFVADGLKAYTQALMFYITGDEVYRANAMQIIRIWEQMDPTKYTYFTDSHIHMGIPLNRMVTAAEILRYSSTQTPTLQWTAKDTDDFTNNLIVPVTETFLHGNNYFMNQHTYPLLGAMSGYIFTDNRARYNEGIEWFTVNKTAVDQGINGSIKQLFRSVDTNAVTGEHLAEPVIQHVEMGRDQAHGGGDLTNAAILARLLNAQGTKVDPVEGTVSTAPNAVDCFDFLDNRILKTANYFWQYMLGYETPWTPVAYKMDENGVTQGIYRVISDSYRGRMTTTQFWDIYYYYTYVKGVNVAEAAPYFYEAFTKRIPSNYYYQGTLSQAWESPDGGGDFWIYTPKAAEAEGATYLPKEMTSDAIVELEDRYTALDNHSETKQEGSTSYIEVTATAEGSTIAPLNFSYADRSTSRIIGIKFRTNGTATLGLSKERNSAPFYNVRLPNTNGEWRYVLYDMGISQVTLSQIDSVYSIMYMTVKGDGTTVDLDHFHVKAGTQLSAPSFKSGKSATTIISSVGIPISLDFSATDSNPTDTVMYEMMNSPAGASLNAGSGVFTWTPGVAGNSSVIVVASDGTSVTTKELNLVVTSDRQSAVNAAIAPYNPSAGYVTASLETYQNAYNDAMAQIQTATDAVFYTKLQTLRSAMVGLQLLTPHLSDGSLDYTKMVSSTFGTSITDLIDNNDNTFSVYQLAGDLYHTIDFGSNFKVTTSAFEIQGRRSFPERISGLTLFGSNDGETWTRLTEGMTDNSEDLQMLNVKEEYKNSKFRFIKMQVIQQPPSTTTTPTNMLEVAEFRMYGERYETVSTIESVSLSSPQAFMNRIVPGNTIKLAWTAKEPISQVTVKIGGQDAAVSSTDNINWSATLAANTTMATGIVKFAINFKKQDGSDGDTAFLTTDNSKLFLVDDSKQLVNVTGITYLIDPTTTTGRPGNTVETLKQTNYLFDANASTSSDFRNGSNGAGGYVTFDFKQDFRALLSMVEIMARQDQVARIKGAVVQGSNDKATWVNLTAGAASTSEWQSFKVSNTTPYRYIRLYNSASWFGNMAEVRFHGSVIDVNQAPVITPITSTSIELGQTVTYTVYASDAEGEAITFSGVDIPAGASIGAGTGHFNWTPQMVGIYPLTLKATDSKGHASTAQTSVIVRPIGVPDVLVNDIQISSVTNAVYVGDTQQMGALVSPVDATNPEVNWSVTSVDGQASIDPVTGVLTGISAGRVTVTAAATDASGVFATYDLTVWDPAGNGGSDTPDSPDTPNTPETPDSTPATGPTPSPTPGPETKPEPDKELEDTSETPFSSIVDEETLVADIKMKLEQQEGGVATFSDTNTHWAQDTVNVFTKLGVIQGYADGSFQPDASITRGEFATVIAKLFNLTADTPASLSDVQQHWAAGAINALAGTGIISGYGDGTFRPNQEITRAEIIAIIAKLVELKPTATSAGFTDIDGAWNKAQISAAAQMGIISGVAEGSFAPGKEATRAEALTILLRVLELNSELKALLH
ncbi:S-layer homology domain-containing protein [Paenibacillus sp. Soil766]|uniref:S-layer homology domain-containing protein n=1 Tax=Paenibacillus sp. Soil766 TaxID=1736404 RepID=UPI0007C7DFC4|nr:S-layer homology domain-containing protein [Paenibacillus sp. Soil766]